MCTFVSENLTVKDSRYQSLLQVEKYENTEQDSGTG